MYGGLTGLTFWRPVAGRRALGVFVAVMAVGVNGTITVVAPDLFVRLAQEVPWAWYQAVGLALTEPAPRVFGAAMVLGELTVAVLILSRGRNARLGLLAAAVFSIGITPLGAYTPANPVLAVGALYLASLDWSVPAFVHPVADTEG